MSGSIEQVVLFTGVTEEVAAAALATHGGDVLKTVDALSCPPRTSGTKYIPPPPKIDDGLTDEVRQKLRDARVLSDLLTFAPQNDLRGKAAHYPPREPAFGASGRPQTLSNPALPPIAN